MPVQHMHAERHLAALIGMCPRRTEQGSPHCFLEDATPAGGKQRMAARRFVRRRHQPGTVLDTTQGQRDDERSPPGLLAFKIDADNEESLDQLDDYAV